MGRRALRGKKIVLTTKTRQYLYGVMLTFAPLAIAYGIVSDSEAGLWLAAVGGVLGISNSVALVNVPKDGE